MSSSSTDDGLVYTGTLPVQIQFLDRLPDADRLVFINEKNESSLRASLIPVEPPDLDEHDEISSELRRHELKINMILEIVEELLLRQTGMPPEAELRLTSKGMECAAMPEAGPAGALVEVAIYLNPTIPKALRLYGELLPAADPGRMAIRFLSTNRTIEDLLEKMIFKHHRRAVAQGISSK